MGKSQRKKANEYLPNRQNKKSWYFNTFRKGVKPMSKKGIQNSSIEQIRNDHETETAFKADDPKKHGSDPKRTK